MADPDPVPPKKKTTPRGRVAQCVRHFGTAERGVKVNAWRTLERTMESEGFTWSDFGNWIDDSERWYSEEEVQDLGERRRREGVETGIAIGQAQARAGNGGGNGHIVLPKLSDIGEYCHQRLGQLRDDEQRNFVREMHVKIQRGMTVKPGPVGYLISLYMKHGGKFQC